MNRLVMSIYLICFVTFALSANAESMMEAFTKFKNTKSNNGGLPGHLKGVVCERSGSKPKSMHWVWFWGIFDMPGSMGAHPEARLSNGDPFRAHFGTCTP